MQICTTGTEPLKNKSLICEQQRSKTRGVSGVDGNDLDAIENLVKDKEGAEDDQAKIDAAVQRGEDFVKNMPDGDENDINLDLNLFNKEANIFLLEQQGGDYIDIDPFGSPVP